ncbi:hypothetical protein ACE1B4_10605 [Aeromonas veronii]|nr:hypothetical protein [Aeromonas veronii]OEC47052.1 hypothetical protein A9G06_10010 [Aeromonas sp. DNP9]TNI07326.1 hypothetical protein CF135_06480 [Aeromonas veronii]HDO1311278.1 hypothetical protein [Aeromonas veronii]
MATPANLSHTITDPPTGSHDNPVEMCAQPDRSQQLTRDKSDTRKSGYGVMAVVHHQKMGQHQRYDDIGLLSLSRWVMSQLADLYFQRKVAEVSVDQGHAPYIIMLKMSWQDTATDGHIR